MELFPARGPLGALYEAGWFIAHNLLRPLTWLGVLENAPQTVPTMSIVDRQFRKTYCSINSSGSAFRSGSRRSSSTDKPQGRGRWVYHVAGTLTPRRRIRRRTTEAQPTVHSAVCKSSRRTMQHRAFLAPTNRPCVWWMLQIWFIAAGLGTALPPTLIMEARWRLRHVRSGPARRGCRFRFPPLPSLC